MARAATTTRTVSDLPGDRRTAGFRVARRLAAASHFADWEESPVNVEDYGVILEPIESVHKAMDKARPLNEPQNLEDAAFLYGFALGLEMAGRGAR